MKRASSFQNSSPWVRTAAAALLFVTVAGLLVNEDANTLLDGTAVRKTPTGGSFAHAADSFVKHAARRGGAANEHFDDDDFDDVRLASRHDVTYDTKELLSLDVTDSSKDEQLAAPMLVQTGRLTLGCRNVTIDFDRMHGKLKELGGTVTRKAVDWDSMWVWHQQEAQRVMATTITFDVKVPSVQFDAAVEVMKAVAQETHREQTESEDVTVQYVDAAAREANLEAARAQLEKLLSSATTVSDTLEVKRELQRVTSDMESYAGRAKYLKQTAELSELHVVLRPLKAQPRDPPLARPPRAWRVVQRSLHQLQSLALCIVDGMIWTAVFLCPVLAVLTVIAVPLWQYGAPGLRRMTARYTRMQGNGGP